MLPNCQQVSERAKTSGALFKPANVFFKLSILFCELLILRCTTNMSKKFKLLTLIR